jgi:hypothetical protein
MLNIWEFGAMVHKYWETGENYILWSTTGFSLQQTLLGRSTQEELDR